MLDDVRFAMVQEADVGDALAVLKTRAPGTTRVIVLAALPSLVGAFVTSPETRRSAFGGRVPPGVAFDKARSAELVGAKVLAKGPSFVELLLSGGTIARLEARGGRVVLRRDPPPLDGTWPSFASVDEATVASWQSEAEAALPRLALHGLTVRIETVKRSLTKAEVRLARRVVAIEGDLARIAQVAELAAKATWLVPAAKTATRGATELRLDDDGTGSAIVMRLDPARPAVAQLEAIFRRAKRLRLGRDVSNLRLTTTRDALAKLGEVRHALEAPNLTLEGLDVLERSAKDAAPRDLSLPSRGASPEGDGRTGKRSREEKRVSFRTYLGLSGARFLVGRGGEDNDTLTFRIASAHDLWLHAKERRGAHVILPLAKGKSPPEGALVEAAHLAAHFSEARDEAVVDVQYAPRKHLRKPRGGAKGLVVVDREKVLVLRVDPALVSKLLDREET